MWKALALAACTASVIAVPVALASEGDITQTTKAESLALAADDPPLPAPSSCQSVKSVYAERNWRLAHPAREAILCPAPKAGRRHTIQHFRDYQRYRDVARYKCLPGMQGYYAVPCYIVSCETGGSYSWSAYNPSSDARGPYQFVGWPVPWPVRSFRDKLAHHIQASELSLSNWACA